MKTLVAILAVFVTVPIWFYLIYQMLTGINASELSWFLFWVYVPVSILVGVLSKLIEGEK